MILQCRANQEPKESGPEFPLADSLGRVPRVNGPYYYYYVLSISGSASSRNGINQRRAHGMSVCYYLLIFPTAKSDSPPSFSPSDACFRFRRLPFAWS